MFEFLKTVHLLALGFGIGSSMGSMVLAPWARRAAAAGTPSPFGAVMPVFANIGLAALALLWISGVWMIFQTYDGNFSISTAFNIKLGLVVLVTIDLLVLAYFRGRARRAGLAPPAAARIFGMLGGLLFIAIVAFAVIAFK